MTFWDDLANDLRDPEFAAEYEAETRLVRMLDGIANTSGTN